MRLHLWLLLISLFTIHYSVASPRPNVVVIMADDLGYGDVGCYGARPENVKTPHIDQLAARGLRFTNGYCSASTCTPTRYSLLTGTYAFRVKGTGIAGPNSPALIQPGTETLPSLLQEAGYKTAVIGKWHLGLGAPGAGPQWNGELKPGPLEIGFDYCFLLPTTNDRVPQVYVENHRVLNLDPADPLWVGHHTPGPEHPTGINQRDTLKMDWHHGHNGTIHNGISRIGFYTGGHAARFRDEDLADKWVEKSEEWITANKDEPFFLFFASHDIHVPRMPHKRFQGQSRMGYRGDAIVQLDWCVGELVRILDEQGLKKNTLLVFCSDNGSVLGDGYQDGAAEKLGDHLPAGPYSGGKYKILEGGTRTPFVTCWPGTIQPGVSDEMVCTIDLATSLANSLGVEIPADQCLDSLDVMGALLGKKGAKGRAHLIEQDNGVNGNYGYRAGKWKLLRYGLRKPKEGEGAVAPAPPRFTLHDLENDAGEKRDVAKQHPEVFERLKTELQRLLDDGRSRPGGNAPDRTGSAPAAESSPHTLKSSAEDYSPDRSLIYKKMGDVELRLHVFNPEGHQANDRRPAIVFFHGGGWSHGEASMFFAHCDYLASRGMVALSAEYRLRKKHQTTPRECLQDGKSAIRWVRQHANELGIDPKRVLAGGGSAGGHIAAATGTTTGFEEEGEDLSISSRPDALVLFNPVFDNGPSGFGHQQVKSYWQEFSPLHNISAQSPPAVVFLGTEDKFISAATAKEYQRRMEEKGRRCELHLYEGKPHGFYRLERSRASYIETVSEMDRFLVSLGYLEGEPAPKKYPEFSWEHIPRYMHVYKQEAFTEEEILWENYTC